VPEGQAAARSRLLDAAQECFGRVGIAKTTVEEIATEAQVSRATVYRYFDGRDDLVLGVVLREMDRHLAKLRPRVERQPSLADAVVELAHTTVRAARRDATLAVLFGLDEDRAAGGAIVGASVAVFERVTAFLVPVLERWADEARAGLDAADAAEWVVRVILSLLAVPGPRRRSSDGERAYLHTYLVPALARPR
jgi:AcrR family transcriptional regulator